MHEFTPVLLAGGSGTRLWPVSRQTLPKQFVGLLSSDSPFQESVRRFIGKKTSPPLVVTGEQYRFLVDKQLAELGVRSGLNILEPEGKNTGPSVLAAALYLLDRDVNAMMVVSPTDHYIPNVDVFMETIDTALGVALDGKICCLGISPTSIQTGYGYIESKAGEGTSVKDIIRFVEKPDFENAKAMIASGSYDWNAGIFAGLASSFVSEFSKYSERMVELVTSSIRDGERQGADLHLSNASWNEIKSISIDYAIMEGNQNAAVVSFQSEWSDLGDWSAVKDMQSSEVNGGVVGGVTSVENQNTFLRNDRDDLHLAAIGLQDTVVVISDDGILVAKETETQKVGAAVTLMKAQEIQQGYSGLIETRPWGKFEIIKDAPDYKIKKITVNPDGQLSLQSHKKRSEHWIILNGVATVTKGDNVSQLRANDVVFIPAGEKHRLANDSSELVEIIEVQTGQYFGEDDIQRFEDIYRR